MAIKAVFPTGKDTISVSGLFQWDYGQILEIESADIGSEIMEVHFACKNMTEAIVRSCSFTDGVGTVVIPDQCLEQSSTITAWLYRIVGTQGHTIKTISLQITERTRPSIVREIPQIISDRYTELITEINESIDNLENGNVTVARAIDADKAAFATSAGNAANANHAVSADNATNATNAPDMGIHTDPEDVDEGQAFGFKNTNGFGVKGGKEYWKLWVLQTDSESGDEEYYCSLVPSRKSKQNLGKSDRPIHHLFADRVILTEGFKTYTTGSRVSLNGLYEIQVFLNDICYTGTISIVNGFPSIAVIGAGHLLEDIYIFALTYDGTFMLRGVSFTGFTGDLLQSGDATLNYRKLF